MTDTPRTPRPGRHAPAGGMLEVAALLRDMTPASPADPWTAFSGQFLHAAAKLAHQPNGTTVLSRSRNAGHHVIAAALKSLRPELRWTAEVGGTPVEAAPADATLSAPVAADDLFQLIGTGLVAHGFHGDEVPDRIGEFCALLIATMADDIVESAAAPAAAPTVLLASVSPPHSDITGAPLRRAAVLDALRAAGFDVEQAAIVASTTAPSPDPSLWTFELPRHAYQASREVHRGVIGPHLRGLEAARDPEIVAGIAAMLERSRPDVVLFEQPFFFPAFAPALERLSYRPVVIYDAHNVEASTTATALEGDAATAAEISRHVEAVRENEQALVDRADVVLAVSEQDAATFRDAMLARQVVLVPNGIARRPEDPANTQRLRDQMRSRGADRLAFFVGADWAPNVVGYLDLVGTDTTWLPERSLIAVAGGACRGIEEAVRVTDPSDAAPFWRQTVLLGRVADTDLASLLALADVVLLPITSGGGSNLKTAEAILSGKHVVATSFALRGYEELADLPQVVVADTPEAFRAAARRALLSPVRERSAGERRRAASVLWENRFPPMIEVIGDLVASGDRRSVPIVTA